MVLCTHTGWNYPEFQFMTIVSVLMAARLSDLDGQKSGVNTQAEGHTLTPPSSQNGPEETEAFSSAPCHSPSHSPVRKPMPDCPETWDCLEIQVTSTEDGGNYTTTSTHLASASCGRHGLRWQIWPDRSCSDWSRQGLPILWVAIFRRRTEPEQDMRCCIHPVRSYWLGW